MRFSNWLKHEITHIYLFHALSTFAMGLFAILVPVYLLSLGYQLKQVLWFYLVQFSVAALAVFIAVQLARRFGLKKIILSRLPFLYGNLILMYSLDTLKTPLWVIGGLIGFEVAFYWIPMESLFGRVTNQKTMGSEVSKLSFYSKIAGVIAPFLGGVIAAFLGFKTLFAIGMVLLALAHIPLFWTRDIKPISKFRFTDMVKFIAKYKAFFWVTSLRSFQQSCELVMWPIFIYFSLNSVLSVGASGSLVALGGALFIRGVGFLTDRFNKKRIMHIGVLLIGIGWILRGVVPAGPLWIYVVSTLAGAVFYVMEVPYWSIGYQIGKQSDIDELVVFREFPIWGARIIFLGLAFLLVGNLQLLFIVIGAIYLLALIY